MYSLFVILEGKFYQHSRRAFTINNSLLINYYFSHVERNTDPRSDQSSSQRTRDLSVEVDLNYAILSFTELSIHLHEPKGLYQPELKCLNVANLAAQSMEPARKAY